MKVLSSDLLFPEGPVALGDGGVLLVEIARGSLTHVAASGDRRVVAAMGGGPNGAAIGPDGRCYVCNNGGISWIADAHGLRPGGAAADYRGGSIECVDLATGAMEVLWTGTRSHPLKGPNDLVFDAEGGIWFTDLGQMRSRDLDRGSVWYAHPGRGELREMVFPMLTPNGIALSPEGDVLYVAETAPARIWRFDLEGPGHIRKAPWPSPHGGWPLGTLPGYRRPDSMAMEAGGNLCIATLGEGGITVLSPQGQEVDFVPLPDSHVTNLCFGGQDMRTAFVTLAGSGRLVAIPWPRPGLRLHNQQTVAP